MSQKNPNLIKVFKAVSIHIPHLVPILGIFSCIFILSAAVSYHQLHDQVLTDGNNAITKLERQVDAIADNLQLLEGHVARDCSTQDKFDLQAEVFNSRIIKEIGLYKDGVVYCTSNEGPTQIQLFSSTWQRIQASPNNVIVSFKESKNKLQTLFVYATSDKTTGINALLHPKHFLESISPAFDTLRYGYQIQILDALVQSNLGEVSLDNGNTFRFQSSLYPFSISIYLTSDAYIHQYLSNLGETVLLALVLSLLYVIVRYQTLARLSIEYSLLSAIKNEQIELYLQPIVDIHSRKMVGSEALVRWNHPAQGRISPEQFIPLAEKLGAIDRITTYMFKEITRFLKRNPGYLTESYISVNISRYQIVKPEFVRFLARYKRQCPDYVDHILLELTENVELTPEQLELALVNLKAIQNLGFDIAIDDFGTGYSGLNLVRMMRFNVVKIDKVFIKSLHTDANIKPVLKSMIQLADDLEMKVIAEGVETEAQIEQLKVLGVKYIQGFYYSKPIKPEELVTFHRMTNEALDLSQPIPRWKS